ncbi:ribosomal-protein-alanine N-acetyltransferase [Aliidiomarina minuta]|uniref:[Ribosomal protein bS18]-alanine N-acetyltransferase n=1 Tax=Aliidiomarina minuta TaxID=880057 RepID=A0A432W4G0_9GAMM|nr:ribosomal protein S18-alanine N-acetyltransferase [Aliidiomarina minuta]RUO24392.1 ribosomal-protein-alanine N-acetyltransferase [Aliidiomarina minuta]
MITLREALVTDASALHQLEQQSFSYDQIGMRSFRRLLKSPSAYCLLALNGEQLAGYAIVLHRQNSQYWRLYSMAISENCRGQGIGQQLLRHILRKAQEERKSGVRLEVKCDNQAAVRLYHRHGFEVTELLPNYYEDGSDGYKMQLSFDTAAVC